MPRAKAIRRLFVAKKPAGIGSNQFLSQLKRKYRVKKAGFSGTLDPFAQGVLIIAFGQYTRLFRFLAKTPKTYRATLWLGAESETLDTEKISAVTIPPVVSTETIEQILQSLKGEITYTPPKYSARKIDGKRAYKLAREEKEVNLHPITSTVYDIRLLHYRHPFVTFEATVSEGSYIRSIGAIIAEKLGYAGSLSMLERLREGKFVYEGEKPLDPTFYLDMETNRYLGDPNDIKLGKKLRIEQFEKQKEARYLVKLDTIFSIIEIRDGLVYYLLNGVEYADTVA